MLLPTVDLMSLSVKAMADGRAGGASTHAETVLLFFRGTLDFGSSRGPLMQALLSLNATDVDVTARNRSAGGVDWALDTAQQAAYIERILKATFCLAPSGHTCESVRWALSLQAPGK